MSRFAELAVRHQKSATTHTKAHDFEHKMDFEYKMIIGCHPELRFITHGLRRCVRESVKTQSQVHGESHLISWHDM